MMRKKIFYIFLFIFIFSLCKLNVSARSIAYCYYNFVPQSDDIGFCYDWNFTNTSCDSKAGLAVVLEYDSDSEKRNIPRLIGKFYSNNKYDFKNLNADEFANLYNNIDYNKNLTFACKPYYILCFTNGGKLPTVNVRNIKDDTGKLTCPNLYLYRKTYNNYYVQNEIDLYQTRWAVSLSSTGVFLGENYDYTYEFEKVAETIYDDGTESSSTVSGKKEVKNCQYKYENYQYVVGFYSTGVFGFSIYDDGSVDGIITSSGDIDNLSFDGNKIESLECPNYLNLNYDLWSGKVLFKVTDKESEADAFYTGNISNADDNIITRYLHLNDSSKIIDVKKSTDGNNYIAVKGSENITVENMNEFINDQTSKMPKYIIETSENKIKKYKFADEVSGGESKNIYMESSYLLNLSILSTDDVTYTCQELFGSDFMDFLKENVYIPVVIAIPILLIVLTTIDFAKVVFIDDKEGIKKAGSRFGKRVIMAVLILLVPTILIFVADIIGVDEVQECAKLIKNYSSENS